MLGMPNPEGGGKTGTSETEAGKMGYMKVTQKVDPSNKVKIIGSGMSLFDYFPKFKLHILH